MNFKKITSLFGIYLILILSFSHLVFSVEDYKKKEDIAKTICGSPMNVKNSLILSIGFLCLPGIIDKLIEYREIECQYVMCSYNSVIYNSDDSYNQNFDENCLNYKNYKTCTYVLGEVSAVSFIYILDTFKKFLYNIISNPLSVLVAGYRQYIKTNCFNELGLIVSDIGLCKSVVVGTFSLYLASIDIPYAEKRVRDLTNVPPNFQSASSCFEIDEIEEELLKIIEDYEIQFETEEEESESSEDKDSSSEDDFPDV